MSFSLVQVVREAAQTITLFHVVEASGFVGVIAAMWRFSLRITTKLGEMMGYFRTLNQEVKDHISNAPTLANCAQQTATIQNMVRAENSKVRDELTAVVVSRDGDVSDLDKRIRKTEQWQARHNGMESGT